MSSVNLKILQDSQSEIFKAEIAGLLHNLGKLHGDFFGKFISSGSTKYNDQRSDEASQVVRFKAARSLIEDTSKSRRGLITALLDDSSVWGSDATIAQGLATEWRKITRTSQQFKEISKDLHSAATTVSVPNTTEIVEAALGACKLADLLQIAGIDRYLDQSVKNWLRNTKLKVLTEEHSLSEILLLYWDDFHSQPNTPNDQMRVSRVERWIDYATLLPRYLATAHAVVSAAEKEKLAEKFKPQESAVPFRASVFGHEVHQVTALILDAARQHLLDLLMSADLSKSDWRQAVAKSFDEHLNLALGDTQWPINDVTLWEFASSIATFFKAAVAKALIEDRFVQTSELKWRLLSIRYDGLEYLSRAHHISDLLARRDALEAALDEVKAVIEVEYPMGNEVYRDENGSVLLVPHVQEGGEAIELLAQECGEGNQKGTLERLLLDRFSEAKYDEAQKRQPLDGEIHPIIALSDKDGFVGEQISLTKAKGWQNPPLQPNPVKVSEWWSDETKHGEICTVCGLRPQGYGAPDDRHPKTGKKGWTFHLKEKHQEKHHLERDPEDCEVCKAQSRQICWVCMERRDDRSKEWAKTALTDFQKTIWTDEVADNNGRVALVVGRFVLAGWLDGTLIPTMQKSASFARIQRCWRTTEEFWKQVERDIPRWFKLPFRSRLTIKPQTAPTDIGPFHSYELEIKGAHLGVVWDANKGEFITCENLDYFQKVAAIKDRRELCNLIACNQPLKLYEPSAHLSRRKEVATLYVSQNGAKIEPPAPDEPLKDPEPSSPFIPILANPALFMALVPADKVLDVIREIKYKYEKEMGKVRDRLSLHVGLVFAPRRTPVRALLEAGRRMLEMPDRWEPWAVESVNHDAKHHVVTFKGSGVTWHVPTVMGDGTTPDQWYPHLMLREPADGEDLTQATPSPWKHAKDLQPGDMVHVRPSRFDFEFLDTTGRRFEIGYDGNGRRRGFATRLFLLEDLKKLDEMWEALAKGSKPLTTSRLQHLESTLTSYINDWFNGDIARAARDATYQTFAKDVLHRLDPKWWKNLNKEQQKDLEEAVTSGLIFDLLELRMHILKEKSDTD